jgi:hypothetical protein
MEASSQRMKRFLYPRMVLALACAVGFVTTTRAQPMQPAVPAASQPAMGAQPSGTAPSTGAQPTRPSTAVARIDVTYLPSDPVAVIALRPKQFLTSANAALLPTEVASAAGKKYFGFDPATIEEVVAFTKQLAMTPPTEYGVVLKFAEPFRGSDIAASIRAHTQPGQLAGRQYLQSKEEGLPSFFAPDNRTLLIAPEATLKQMMERKEPGTVPPLMQRVRLSRGHHDVYFALDAATIRPYLQLGLGLAQSQLPTGAAAEAPQLMESAELVTSAELTFNLSNTGPTSLVLNTNDPTSAQKLDKIFADVGKAYQESEIAKAQAFSASDDPITKAYGAYLQRTAALWAGTMRPERSGQSLILFRIEGGSREQKYVAASAARIAMSAFFPTNAADAAAGPSGIDLGSMIQQIMSGAGAALPPAMPGVDISSDPASNGRGTTTEQPSPENADPAMGQQAGQQRRAGNRRGRRNSSEARGRGSEGRDGM